MVCGDCEKKLTKIVGVDPYRHKKTNRAADGSGPKTVTTKNRLIGVQKKTSIVGVRCKLCKQLIHQPGSHYCSTCAYQKGICAMCGKKIINTKGLRQSTT
uniref:Cysteine-rich PDZ-binding protein n=1 Tax=Caenorhabditis japonica TaxID=281687 RepID=A0A8R1DEW9_CAEJA